MSKTRIEWCDYDKGWIEAFIDSEGWLSLIKEKRPKFKAGCTYKPLLGVSNTNHDMIEKARLLLGACNHKWMNGNGVSMLAINSGRLRSILPELKLIAKDKQRLLLIEALNILSEHKGRNNPRSDLELTRLEEIYREMQGLNANSGGKQYATH